MELLDATGKVVRSSHVHRPGRGHARRSNGTAAMPMAAPMRAGNYTMRATVMADNGATAATLTTDTVTGVTDSADGVMALLAGGQQIAVGSISGMFCQHSRTPKVNQSQGACDMGFQQRPQRTQRGGPEPRRDRQQRRQREHRGLQVARAPSSPTSTPTRLRRRRAAASGIGVTVSDRSQQFTQGDISATRQPARHGDQRQRLLSAVAATARSPTRATASSSLDKDGYIVNATEPAPDRLRGRCATAR